MNNINPKPQNCFIKIRYPIALVVSVATWLIGAQYSTLSAAPSAAPVTEVVVKTNDLTSDGDGKFDAVGAFTLPALNNCGSAAFRARLNKTSTADPFLPQPYFGLFLGEASKLSQVARIRDPAPGGAPADEFLDFGSTSAGVYGGPAVNDSGQLLFMSHVVTNNTRSICLFRSGPFSRLLNWGQPAPVGNGMVYLANTGQAPAFNQKGDGAFVSSLRDANFTPIGSAIYRVGTPGKLIQIVREGQPLPGGSGTFGPMVAANSTHLILNESGQVAFFNTSAGAIEGLYRGNGSTPIKIARLGDALPGGGSIGAFGGDRGPDMNDAGDIVFAVDLAVTGDHAIFKASNGALTKIARRGDPIPNSSDTFQVFDGYARINKSGQVGFIADVDAPPGNSSYYGIFRRDGDVTKTIVLEGQATPNRAGIFSSLHQNTFCLNDSGQVAFTAGLDVDLSNNTPVEEHGIFFFNGTQRLQVARENDSLLGSTIAALRLAGTVQVNFGGVAPAERSGLNEAGQVAFGFTLKDGREGIAIWSPTLKLLCASSRKIHGTNKTFDFELPLTGKLGVECRSSSFASGGAHDNFTLLLRFTNKLSSVGSARVTTGIGSVLGTPTIKGNTMTVNLTGVTNAQKIIVAVNNVTDAYGRTLASANVPMGVLFGDVDGNRSVNTTDVNAVSGKVGSTASQTTFRDDVDINGSITQADVTATQNHQGTSF